MNSWLRGRGKALLGFGCIAGLVVGGLGWMTITLLHMEELQHKSDFERELSSQLGLALWRLDSRIAPSLAKEDSRPYDHYAAFAPPPLLLKSDGTPVRAGDILAPSPLVSAELPPWMLLHFQADAVLGWASPQVLSQSLSRVLEDPRVTAPLDNVTEKREQMLLDLAGNLPPQNLLEQVETRCAQLPSLETIVLPTSNSMQGQQDLVQGAQQDFNRNQDSNRNPFQGMQRQFDNSLDTQARNYTQEQIKKEVQNKVQLADLNVALANMKRNGEGWFSRNPLRTAKSQKALVSLGPMVPLWVTPNDQEQRLVMARLVKIGDKQFCQGVVLDWEKLQVELSGVVADLFPGATFGPMQDAVPATPERTMKWLPVQLNPGDVTPMPLPLWTPLRVGLAAAWAGSLVALLAMFLGGWSLISLSERRIRFVSAVTHELRTPLTTLRLYLDMLTGGMVQEEEQRAEYLQTLHSETERLHRLVANVLDFSRLERQRPRLEMATVAPVAMMEEVQTDWQDRCKSNDKQLVVENQLPAETAIKTDVKLAQQVLGCLIDNACKYSRGADDARITLRSRAERGRVVLEVEDRGPGVPARERRSIFRAFRRGRAADAATGGVGLGLALAKQWAKLLGGRLNVGAGAEGKGACFRLELPK